MSRTSTRLVIGMMTGTSMDGLDAALVAIEGAGLAIRPELVCHHSRPLGAAGPHLKHFADGEAMTARQIADLAWRFGELHAEAISELLSRAGHSHDTIALVAVHGQTVVHAPPCSWQMINIMPISRLVTCPIVFDLRQLDLANGGEGAPITPLADWIMFRARDRHRQIINLGGFANVTRLPAGNDPGLITGRDLCSCNRLLDAIAQTQLGLSFDPDGAHAMRGMVQSEICAEIEAILREQYLRDTSLGDADPVLHWVASKSLLALPGADLAASTACAIARVIAGDVNQCDADEVLLAGGGIHHQRLVQCLQQEINARVALTDELGVPADAREAMAMAVLGCLASDGIAITLPQVTRRSSTTSAHRDGLWMQPR